MSNPNFTYFKDRNESWLDFCSSVNNERRSVLCCPNERATLVRSGSLRERSTSFEVFALPMTILLLLSSSKTNKKSIG